MCKKSSIFSIKSKVYYEEIFIKLKKEEKWLIEIFGEDYHNYKKTTRFTEWLPY
jgi:protein-S-isoprenylcysteine O-methyltransferase Ste14